MYEISILPIEEFDLGFKVGSAFQESCKSLQDPPNLEHTKAMFKVFYDNNMGAMLVAYDTKTKEYVGMLACIVAPDIFSGVVTAQELAWFVQPNHRRCGVRLFKAFEQWATDNKAKYIAVCHMLDSMPEKVGSFYNKMGYSKQDIIYRKELTCQL